MEGYSGGVALKLIGASPTTYIPTQSRNFTARQVTRTRARMQFLLRYIAIFIHFAATDKQYRDITAGRPSNVSLLTICRYNFRVEETVRFAYEVNLASY